ncbi:MAG: TonB-dependent receptor [Bacteroidales bacterium]|nr:TonB-dependent receptor [Bacteroidales bacterium]
MFRKIVTIFLLLLAGSSAFGQKQNRATISGTVVSAADGKAMDFVSVVVKPSELYSVTDREGRFSIGNIPAGNVSLSVQYFGMETIDTTFYVKNGGRYELEFAMKESSFRLDNVVVVATGSKAGSSTASNISRQAMDHIQSGSLKDVMALLPGVAVSNPSLSKAQALNIRTLSVQSSDGKLSSSASMNSLGTAVIVDGAPLSNNANMQVLSPSMVGNSTPETGGASPTAGVDVRALSTDNIESVEVIRGIPSVAYGDMTSGVVVVKSRAGKSPLNIRFKTNPNIYQLSAAKGFGLRGDGGDLNVSADYAYNLNSLTKSFASYQRASLKGLWSIMPGQKTSVNTALTLNCGYDRTKLNPDDEKTHTQSKATDLGISFNNNGNWNAGLGWFRSLDWTASFTFTNKDSHYESLATNALNLYSTAMEDGLVYTNIAGLQLNDADGNRITNVSEDSPVTGRVLPYSYLYQYDIFGKELNGFAKINARLGKSWEKVNERILVGADYKTDGNLGKGAVYDDATPPFRTTNMSSGYRRRPYYDIPFIHQIGLYAENVFDWTFAGRKLAVTAGVRFDWVNSLTSVAPRINASIDIFPEVFTLRGGWGITSKAPTSLYLYPNYAYQDLVNYNGMSSSIPEEERLLVATTRVYDTRNYNLEIARNRKAEIGFDALIAGRFRISVTAFDELMNNGYTFSITPESIKWTQYQQYEVASKNPGGIPTLKAGTTYNTFFTYYTPTNNLRIWNSGVEYEIDLGRFDAIRTSFYINGAWMRTSTTYLGNTFSTRTSTAIENHIGVYAPAKSTSYAENLNTTFRITHNIPRIGFVVTLTGQANWYSKSWATYRNDEMFESYIDYRDGQIKPFDPSKKDDPEFSYLFPTLSDSRFIVDKVFPTFLLNLNLTKEIGELLTASFYVNNVFNSRPIWKPEVGEAKELGIPIFFGFELKMTIK